MEQVHSSYTFRNISKIEDMVMHILEATMVRGDLNVEIELVKRDVDNLNTNGPLELQRHRIPPSPPTLPTANNNAITETTPKDQQQKQQISSEQKIEVSIPQIYGPRTRKLSLSRWPQTVVRILAILQKMHENLASGQVCSLRDMYYALGNLGTKSQRGVNDLVLDIAATFGCGRTELGVQPSSDGKFAGAIKVRFEYGAGSKAKGMQNRMHYSSLWGGDHDDVTENSISATTAKNKSVLIDASLACSDGIPIPGDTNAISCMHVQVDPSTRCILVIEKEGIFQSLIRNQIYNRSLPCILVCGVGYPSVSTRMFLRKLSELTGLETYGLVDFNPHGLSLLMKYRHGGARTAIEGNFDVDIKWLGLRSLQVKNLVSVLFSDPEAAASSTIFEELGPNSMAVVQNLKQTCPTVQQNDAYLYELDQMVSLGSVQLQALFSRDTEWVCTNYIPRLVIQGDYV